MSSRSGKHKSNSRQGEWSGWEFDYSVNRYKRTRYENGYLKAEYYQDQGTAQIQQETTPHSEFQQSAEQYGQYSVPSPTPASNNLYVGGQAQRQDYGGQGWTSASTFQTVPSPSPQLNFVTDPSPGSQLNFVTDPSLGPRLNSTTNYSTNYSGPTYNPNDSNNASRYDPVGSISSQLANTTLSGSPGLRDPASLASNRLVSANNPKEQTERLDPRFRVIGEPKRFFKVGRVFAVLWSEPAGENVDWSDEDDYEIVRYGEKVFTKIRRFVVVREGDRHSTCLPLLTYQGKATRKHGVNPDDHAAVFAEHSKPRLLPGENLRKSSLKIVIEDLREKIDPLTRINFSKIYTVEHNVKALKIGRISDTDLLRKYFIECIAGPEVTSQGSYTQASGPSAQMGESTPRTLGLTPNDMQNYTALPGEQLESGDIQSLPNSSSTEYQMPQQGFNQSFDPGGVTQYQQSYTHGYNSGQYNQSNQSNLYPDPRRFTGGGIDNEASSPRDYEGEPEPSREIDEPDFVEEPRYTLPPPRPISSMSHKYEGSRRSKHGGSTKEKDRDRDRRRR